MSNRIVVTGLLYGDDGALVLASSQQKFVDYVLCLRNSTTALIFGSSSPKKRISLHGLGCWRGLWIHRHVRDSAIEFQPLMAALPVLLTNSLALSLSVWQA